MDIALYCAPIFLDRGTHQYVCPRGGYAHASMPSIQRNFNDGLRRRCGSVHIAINAFTCATLFTSTEALSAIALRFQVVHLCNGVKFPQRVRYQHMNSREWRCRRSHVQVHAPELGPNPRARSLLQGTITLASGLYGDKQGTHKVMLPPTLRQLSGSAQVAVGWLLLISVQETKLAKSGYGAIAWLPDTEV